MIIILEGAERTGKTTFADMLENCGFINFKDIVHIDADVSTYNKKNIENRLDATLNILSKLDEKNIDIVVDRMHISEAVFSNIYRGEKDRTVTKFIDFALSKFNDVRLVLMTRIIDSSYLASHPSHDNKLIERIVEKFDYEYGKSEIKKKYVFDFYQDKLEYILEDLGIIERFETSYKAKNCPEVLESEKENIKRIKMHEGFAYDFYLASPFFTPEQKEREEKIKKLLRDFGYRVYAPIEAGIVKAEEDSDFVAKIFNSNVEAINNSERILAITDGKDMGTIWEAGYGYGIGKPVIYYAETLGNNPFNIMLSESGSGIFKNYNDLKTACARNQFYIKDEVKHE